MNCTTCDHPMRPTGTKAADHPGTWAHGTKNTCATCYQRVLRTRSREGKTKRHPTTRPCLGCERPMRTSSELLADRPGTVSHYSGDRCKQCHVRRFITVNASNNFAHLHARPQRTTCARCPQPHGWTLGRSSGLCRDCSRGMTVEEREMWAA